MYSSAYYSPPPSPRVLHETQNCPCDECIWARSYPNMDPRSSPELELAESDVPETPHHEPPKMRNGQKNGAKKSDTESPKKYQRPNEHPLAATTIPRPEMAYPEVYIYPSSSHHITFPVVNYSSRQRVDKQAPWPACYLAISPQCAKPADFEAALCPRGSGLMVVARLSKTQKTAPLSSFRDAGELRRDSIQLEVWDVDTTKTHAKNDHGSETEAGIGSSSNGAEIGAAKKKKGRSRD
ncbi:hypothetical protein F5Y13DRAFT_168715 [Hypoxylon sp. FL1857]|nr:hypothetical protein F5Y13DRAFT_168715 [Hypoxylon sp. FL1857]